jgi:hypothetical protein
MSAPTGQCYCGLIRFEFSDEPTEVSFCHCSICRRLTGSAFGAYLETSNESLRILTGAEKLSKYKPTARLEKRFCSNCGVTLFTNHADFSGHTYVSLGVISDAREILPQYHQFVGSKAKWHQIGDELPQFEKCP